MRQPESLWSFLTIASLGMAVIMYWSVILPSSR